MTIALTAIESLTQISSRKGEVCANVNKNQVTSKGKLSKSFKILRKGKFDAQIRSKLSDGLIARRSKCSIACFSCNVSRTTGLKTPSNGFTTKDLI